MSEPKFKYGQKVKIKSPPKDNPSFHNDQTGFVLDMESKQIVASGDLKFYSYLVELDDEFKLRVRFKEAYLETTK